MNPIYPDRLPNFFIIGAAKSGTTAIAKLISKHPRIFLRPEKEIQYFSNDEHYRQGLSFLYSRHGKNAQAAEIRCDASPQYLYNKKVVARIQHLYGELIDQCKIFVILRNPAQRAHSAYWMAVRYGWDRRSFDQAITDNLAVSNENKYENTGLFNINSYIEGGKYYSQLKPWLEAFRRDQFLIVPYDLLENNPHALYEQLQLFLNVSEPFDTNVVKPVNAASLPRFNSILRFTEERHSIKDFFKPLLARELRTKLRYALRDANLKPFKYTPMSEWTRLTLNDVYAEEIRMLEELLDWNLSNWVN